MKKVSSDFNKTSITPTRGDIVVENISIGDIHFEYEFNFKIGMKLKVITKPRRIGSFWQWESKNLKTGKIFKYVVNTNKNTRYKPNLFSRPKGIIKQTTYV